MNQPSSLKARLVEILIELSPDERKVVIEELKEVVRIVSSADDFSISISEPSNPRSRFDPGIGLSFWN
jgi:hypothetical protein